MRFGMSTRNINKAATARKSQARRVLHKLCCLQLLSASVSATAEFQGCIGRSNYSQNIFIEIETDPIGCWFNKVILSMAANCPETQTNSEMGGFTCTQIAVTLPGPWGPRNSPAARPQESGN